MNVIVRTPECKGNKVILTVEGKPEKIMATLQNGDKIERYECSISACENPACNCGTAYLDLIPTKVEDKNTEQLPRRRVEIDVIDRSLGYRNKKQVPKEDLAFAKLFLSKLDEKDFQILNKSHFEFKNKISEAAPPDAIDVHFKFNKIENDGLMSAYNDVLPYGDQLYLTINGQECIIFDQYCLSPKCPCTDIVLHIFSLHKAGKRARELYLASLNYRNKQWKVMEGFSFPIALETVRKAIEDQLPNIYNRLYKRHIKLKAIYAHCRKKHYSFKREREKEKERKQEPPRPKVGRNHPCPCGSGKKYKKCCLLKSG